MRLILLLRVFEMVIIYLKDLKSNFNFGFMVLLREKIWIFFLWFNIFCEVSKMVFKIFLWKLFLNIYLFIFIYIEFVCKVEKVFIRKIIRGC